MAASEDPSSRSPMLGEMDTSEHGGVASEEDFIVDIEEGGEQGVEDTAARELTGMLGDARPWFSRANCLVASIVLVLLCLSALAAGGFRRLLDQEDPSWGRQAETAASRALVVLGVGAPAANGTGGNLSEFRAVGDAMGPAAASGASGNASVGPAASGGNLSGPACNPAVCGTLDRVGGGFKEVQHWDGWKKVFPFMVTSTSSTTTTTTFTTTTTTSTTTSTSTTTTTTPCAIPTEGDDCYQKVLRAMYDIQVRPDQYTPLNNWSSFEEVQNWLHKTNDTTCSEACECRPAWTGSTCYKAVTYAMGVGVLEHPEWYPGLTRNSSFDEFHEHLWHWDNKSECVRPCMLYPKPDHLTLFCWSVSRNSGYEADVMKEQLTAGAGIFACDGFAVLCESEWHVGWGPGERIGEVNAITFKGAGVGTSKDGTAANAELFMNAWEAVLEHTMAMEFDWTIKVDPDAVVVPHRLREHFHDLSGKKVFVRNCNKLPWDPQFPMMFGSLEALSNGALAVYKNEAWRCKTELDWRPWGEDYFLGKCLPLLGINPVDDFTIISDGVCTDANCYDSWSAAFHPFKSAEEWMNCWEAATAQGGIWGPTLPPLP